MTVRYPASETDPTGTSVETDNAALSNPPSVRLPQASDPCQADLLNAPAKELRDRLALVEAGAVWHAGATDAPANTQQIKLVLDIGGDVPFAETTLGLGGYAFECKYNNYNQATPLMKTNVEPGEIKLIKGPAGTTRGVLLEASLEALNISSLLRGACSVGIIGSLTATSLSATGDIGAGGKVTATGKVRAPNIPAIITGAYDVSTSKWSVIADGTLISTARSSYADVWDDIVSWCNTNGIGTTGFTVWFTNASPTSGASALTGSGCAYLAGAPIATSIPADAKAFVFVGYPM